MAFNTELVAVFCLLFSGALSLQGPVSRATGIVTASLREANLNGLRNAGHSHDGRVLLGTHTDAGRSLKARRRRRRSNSGEAAQTTCHWNASESTCGLSLTTTEGYLRGLESDFASLVTNFAACEAAGTKKACRKAGDCVWNSDTKRCYFVDILSGRESSRCYKKAPGSVRLMVDSALCASVSGDETCNSEPYCTWDDDLGTCVPDGFPLYYGFTAEEFSAVVETVAIPWAQELDSSFDFDDPVFEWSDLLEWSGPEQVCTEDASPELCAYLEEGYVPLLPYIYYCVLQYDESSDADACNADPYCQFDEEEESCSIGDDASITLFTATLHQVDAEVDRTILAQAVDCAGKTKKKCKGKCIWSPEDEECTFSDTGAYAQVAAVDKRGEDTLCRYLKAAVDSGCLDVEYENDCEGLSACRWRTLDDECLPSVKYLTEIAAKEEGKWRSFNRMEKKCSEHEEKADCLSVK